MRLIFPLVVLFASACSYADTTEGAKNQQLTASTVDAGIIERAKVERDKIKSLVDAGALPKSRLDMAELSVQDAEDEATLRSSLYGRLAIEQTTKQQIDDMIAASQRLYDRQKQRLDEAEKLVDNGVAARAMLTPILEDLDSRKKTLDLAQSRARLFDELAAMAKAEALEAESRTSGNASEFDGVMRHFVGKNSFNDSDFHSVETAFEKKFGKPLPVSAFGETALHRSLGFDHRGRVDVAINPDQQEGLWLRSYLETHEMPYFAFRAAVAGKATGPHIHMGPPSTRLLASATPLVRVRAKRRVAHPAVQIAD